MFASEIHTVCACVLKRRKDISLDKIYMILRYYRLEGNLTRGAEDGGVAEVNHVPMKREEKRREEKRKEKKERET